MNRRSTASPQAAHRQFKRLRPSAEDATAKSTSSFQNGIVDDGGKRRLKSGQVKRQSCRKRHRSVAAGHIVSLFLSVAPMVVS